MSDTTCGLFFEQFEAFGRSEQFVCLKCGRIAADHPSQEPVKGNLVVTLLSDHGTVWSKHLLLHKNVPRTLEEFWDLIIAEGVDRDRLEDGRVSVLTSTGGWIKMTPLGIEEKFLSKLEECYQYQVQRFNTPYKSPTQPPGMDATFNNRNNSMLLENFRLIFSTNPFQSNAIPNLYHDTAMLKLSDWFTSKTGENVDTVAIATIFAMPGSGKTRSVQEAAKRAMSNHTRIRICDVDYEEVKSCKEFVQNCVSRRIKRIDTDKKSNTTPFTSPSCTCISIHFDEVQSLLGYEDGEDLLKKLAAECTAVANQDKRLKFVFTGTNIKAKKPIDFGSQCKTETFFLDGSFPKEFVHSLYKEHIKNSMIDNEMEGLLEGCRHNRRVTAIFLKNLWDARRSQEAETTVLKHYQDALDVVKKSITSQIGTDANPAACRIFRVLLQAINSSCPPSSLEAGLPKSKVVAVTVDTSKFASDLAYVHGGGLNVCGEDQEGDSGKITVNVFLPEGCVFEILTMTMGRAGQRSTYNNLLSFLRTARVKEFNFGWFMEALVVHDLKCVTSEFETLLNCGQRHAEIMEAEVVNEPKLWECIPKDSSNFIWWVRDEMNSHQDCWIDIGYRQADNHVVIVECKSDLKEKAGVVRNFFEKAIALAKKHSSIQWIAVYLCLVEPKNNEKPTEVVGNLQMKILVLPIHSEMAKTLRDAKENGLEQQDSLVDRLGSGGIQADSDGVYAGGSQGLVSTPVLGKRKRPDPQKSL